MHMQSSQAAQPAKQNVPAESIAPETLAAIFAAAAAFLGRAIELRSVKLLPAAQNAVNRWSRQGRASVHASHNLHPRR
jgi:hypothetical protein